QNIALWNGRYSPHFAKWGTAVLIQGDSRNLKKNIQDYADMSLSSPPFGAAQTYGKAIVYKNGDRIQNRAYSPENQGQTTGNLALLETKESDFEAAVTSPVYAE